MTLPANGSTIVFDRVPSGSYAEPGIAYRVAVQGKGARRTIYLTNALTGASSSDRAYAYGAASFRAA